MKETITDYEEVETELVYCDECGDECTEDYKVRPSHVCQSCSEDGVVYRTAEQMYDRVMENTPTSDMDDGLFTSTVIMSVFMLMIYPLALGGALGGKKKAVAMAGAIHGGVVYGILIGILLAVIFL